MGAQQPAALQLLKGRGNGTDSGGRKVKEPPNFKRVPPTAPDWLSAEAAAEWARVVPGLQRLDLLKEEDRAVLAAYCETWSTYVVAVRLVATEGLTIEAKQGMLPHPAVGIARSAGRELRAFAGQFGLSPVAEMALGQVGDDGAEDSNPFSG
ncbi:phage terminase small subunit P27 family [Nocardioides aurantiacus]|uniref:P27 family predicted phage terminase small subunit n=1 Tax=Nocardioides aurantiacus TaxID=86796 RepID=A0A3N2CWG6_9ACTN|nr:phage terminase small subunit P27 family [Nocardioides aurantiacus]ROR91758.1 P27 family predicted phage terminase small subunit [Nocardioides aurantiacus]